MSKLLKYDIKSFIFNHIAVIIVLFTNALIVVTTKAFMPVSGQFSFFMQLTHSLFKGIFSITLILLPVMTFIMVISRYKRKVLGDEAYLTHTLPVSKKDILLATTFNAIIYFVIDLIAMILASLIVFDLSYLLDFFGLVTKPDIVMLILVVLIIPTMVITYLYQFILAFTMGYSHETNKVKNTILYGIGLYLLNQMVGVLLIGIGFIMIFINSTINVAYIFAIILVAYVCLLLLTYSIINYRLKNKLNLE